MAQNANAYQESRVVSEQTLATRPSNNSAQMKQQIALRTEYSDACVDELSVLQDLLRDADFAFDMAQHLEGAYYRSQGKTPPAFMTSADYVAVHTMTRYKEMLGTNLASFYAVEAGIGVIAERTHKTPRVILEDIVRRQVSSEDLSFMVSLARSSWKASQPFRSLDRIRNPAFTVDLLSAAHDREEGVSQINAAAELLLAHIPFGTPRRMQISILARLLQDKGFSYQMGKHLHDAYYEGKDEASQFPDEDALNTISVNKKQYDIKIARNMPGFYALEGGLVYLTQHTNLSPMTLLQSIVDKTLSRTDMLLLARFANVTWKQSQQFLPGDRLLRDNFIPAVRLSHSELEKDFVQIYAAAEKLLQVMKDRLPEKKYHTRLSDRRNATFSRLGLSQKCVRQLDTIRMLLRRVDFIFELATRLERKWEDIAGQTSAAQDIAAISPDDVVKRKRETEILGSNLAGFYALESGISYLAEARNKGPREYMEDIVRGTIPSEDMQLLVYFADLTWKASQPFRGLERIKRAPFTSMMYQTQRDYETTRAQLIGAAELLITRIPNKSTSIEQHEKMHALLRDRDFAEEMAGFLHNIYENTQKTPRPFPSPSTFNETITRSTQAERLAIQSTGFYALEAGINYLVERTNKTPEDILHEIIDEEITSDTKRLLIHFANAAWKTGKPFVSVDDIEGVTFCPVTLLAKKHIDRAFEKIQKEAYKLLIKLKEMEIFEDSIDIASLKIMVNGETATIANANRSAPFHDDPTTLNNLMEESIAANKIVQNFPQISESISEIMHVRHGRQLFEGGTLLFFVTRVLLAGAHKAIQKTKDQKGKIIMTLSIERGKLLIRIQDEGMSREAYEVQDITHERGKSALQSGFVSSLGGEMHRYDNRDDLGLDQQGTTVTVYLPMPKIGKAMIDMSKIKPLYTEFDSALSRDEVKGKLRNEHNVDHIIAFATSLKIFDEDITMARAAIREYLLQFNPERTLIVSGATFEQGLCLLYEVADEMGFRTMGVVPHCAKEYRMYALDFMYYSGKVFGDESGAFLSICDELVTFAGGPQTFTEVEKMATMYQRKKVTLLPGIRTYDYETGKPFLGTTDTQLKAKYPEFIFQGNGKMRMAMETAKSSISVLKSA